MKVKIKILETTKSEIELAMNEYIGYCINCGDFTNDQVEPDARKYECEGCGLRTVYGTEEAFLNGWIVEVKDDPKDLNEKKEDENNI